jgi:hypothetical protein
MLSPLNEFKLQLYITLYLLGKHEMRALSYYFYEAVRVDIDSMRFVDKIKFHELKGY